jgi:hypothetical protein
MGANGGIRVQSAPRGGAVITLMDDGLGGFTTDIQFYLNGIRRDVKHLPPDSPAANAALRLARSIVVDKVALGKPLPREEGR